MKVKVYTVVDKIVRSSPAVVQNYDDESREGLPILISDLSDLVKKRMQQARVDELNKLVFKFESKQAPKNYFEVKSAINKRLETLGGSDD